MKASAGSGKTYNLAREYIRLLLMPAEVDGKLSRDPYAYRHILAVTFTNKATAEMKTRIIDELDVLATCASSSAYFDFLKEECLYSSEEEMRADAVRVLSNMLNDYGAFHVSTIDSFFQQTLRAFAREIGQVAEYQVELDRNSLVGEAADRVLDSLSEEDNGLLKWLSASSIEQIEDGNGFHLERVIGDFAQGYMSDGYRTKAEAIGLDEDKAFSEENIKKLRRICRKVVNDYDTMLMSAVAGLQNAFSGYTGVNQNLLKNIAALAELDCSGTIKLDGFTTMRNCAEDGSKCFTGKAKKEYGEAGAAAAETLLREFFKLEDRRLTIRNTAKILEGQVYVFRVAEALKIEFDKLLKEKNVLSLNDTNAILRDIIGGTELPFIYEKLGVRLRHFLLDEFQDTSVIQWDNFMPILRESISQGCYNLIVGDVKQSIYRWRDTDWKIIDERVEADLPRVLQDPLDTNWRSGRTIVEFNNAFYSVLSSRMDRQLEALEEKSDDTIQRIYSDVRQDVSGKIAVPGCIEMMFCNPKELAANAVASVLDARDNRHFALKDIAVIVRSNSQGGEIASALIGAGVAVVTNDSLRISSSEAVRCAVARLYRCNDPEEKTMSFYEGDFDPDTVDGGGSILSLSEEILRGIEVTDGDTSYVLAFLDLVRDFEKKNGNSLDAFLKYWEEDGAAKSISSPEGSEAVTVITIHKCKGLAYPCVVLPFPKKGTLMKSGDKHWECPDLSGTELECLEPSLYHVMLSEKTQNDLFRNEMLKERRMQYIDTLNMWYVATTRATQLMYLIAPEPSDTLLKALPDILGDDTPWPKFGSVAEALYIYTRMPASGFCPVEDDLSVVTADGDGPVERYRAGEPGPKWIAPKKAGQPGPKRVIHGVGLKYVSYAQGNMCGKLRMRDDSREFFFPEECDAVETAGSRLNGIIIHSVLEHVNVPSDLRRAMDHVVFDGLIDAGEALEMEKFLAGAIASVEDRGWFSVGGSVYRNERTIVDPVSGTQTRPDRVVVKDDGSVEIIDYKTGSKSPDHVAQVRGYMDSYRRMGYDVVKGFIWYLGREVCDV